jgi:hypothetical protein
MGHANFVKLKGKTLATRSYADAWAGTMTGEPSNVVKIESLHKIGKGVERLYLEDCSTNCKILLIWIYKCVKVIIHEENNI